MIFHSIRWRILAWNFALLAATASILLVAFYRHEKQARLQELDLRLRQEMTRGMGAINEVVPGLGGPRSPGSAPAVRPNGKAAPRGDSQEQRATKARQALTEIVDTGVWVQAVDPAGKPLYRSPNAPEDPRAHRSGLGRARDAFGRRPSAAAGPDGDPPGAPGPVTPPAGSQLGDVRQSHRSD